MKKLISSYGMHALSAIALVLFVMNAPVLGAEDTATHDGKVVSVTSDKLVMTSEKGEEHAHTMTADAKLTLDGKICKANELKVGMRIRVTTQATEKKLASRIEGLDKNLEFMSFRHDGKIVSITGNKLVMTGMQGKDEQTCTLTPNVQIICDTKVCKPSDLKAGMSIRMTSASDDPHSAIRIEAIDKNLEFANSFHEGKFVSMIDNKLVMTGTPSKEERRCAMRSDVKVTLDGKVCKSSDLKPGMRVRITLESAEPQSASRIEALEKNPEFASL